MRGPAPKSREHRELAGNPGKRPLDAAVSVTPSGKPRKPLHMTTRAGQKWERMVRDHPDRFDASDAEILALYCETWATWVECKGKVEADGIMHNGKLAPWFSGMERARALMRSMLTQFGMTPADRTRVAMPDDGEKGSEGDGDFD